MNQSESPTSGVATLDRSDSYESLHAELASFGQEHVFDFWHELNATEQEVLLGQLQSLDLREIQSLFEKAGSEQASDSFQGEFQPPVAFGGENGSSSEEAIREAGESALRAGKVGVVIVAGGQGSRLGFDHPKGMYPVGPLSETTLFEVLFGKIKAVGERYGVDVPVYLMTSPATHAETVEFITANEFFGLSKANVCVFCQGTMPAVSLTDGRLIMSSKGTVFESPDGHGGMLAGLQRNGVFDDLAERQVEHLFYMQIDNALVEVASPIALGHHLNSQADATTMVIRKTNAKEKVGNVAVYNGQTQIVEYSDLPEEIAARTNEDGSLEFWAGNVAVHLWNVEFLRSMAKESGGLPIHFAKKKVPHVTRDGEFVRPSDPNGLKFERFIFDLLPAAEKAIVVEVNRDEFFAPLKNPSGTGSDDPETVRQQITSLHRRWIEAAGGTVEDGVVVEILPSFAIDASQVAEKLEPGQHFSSDTVLA